MNSSPIESWEDASAIFTFADSPGVMYIVLALVVAVVVGVLVASAIHETKSFDRAERGE